MTRRILWDIRILDLGESGDSLVTRLVMVPLVATRATRTGLRKARSNEAADVDVVSRYDKSLAVFDIGNGNRWRSACQAFGPAMVGAISLASRRRRPARG